MASSKGSSIRDRAASGVDPQDGLFDKQWPDAELEAALEKREQLNQQKLAAQRAYKVAHDTVKHELDRFELAVGEVARCGRFKIKKQHRQGNSVAFDTQPREQLSIGLVDTGDDS